MTKPETVDASDPWREWKRAEGERDDARAEIDRLRQRCIDLQNAVTACGLFLDGFARQLQKLTTRGVISDTPGTVVGGSLARLIERDYGSWSVSRDVAYINAFTFAGNKGVGAMDAIERVITLAPEG